MIGGGRPLGAPELHAAFGGIGRDGHRHLGLVPHEIIQLRFGELLVGDVTLQGALEPAAEGKQGRQGTGQEHEKLGVEARGQPQPDDQRGDPGADAEEDDDEARQNELQRHDAEP